MSQIFSFHVGLNYDAPLQPSSEQGVFTLEFSPVFECSTGGTYLHVHPHPSGDNVDANILVRNLRQHRLDRVNNNGGGA